MVNCSGTQSVVTECSVLLELTSDHCTSVGRVGGSLHTCLGLVAILAQVCCDSPPTHPYIHTRSRVLHFVSLASSGWHALAFCKARAFRLSQACFRSRFRLSSKPVLSGFHKPVLGRGRCAIPPRVLRSLTHVALLRFQPSS